MNNATGFITSQGDTAPKPRRRLYAVWNRFITSQGDTAPKPWFGG